MAESDEEISTIQNPLDKEKWLERIRTFEDMHFRTLLLRGIYGYGCERPSDIQRLAIVSCILGRDVLVQSNTGTGKTLAWILSILQRLDMNIKDCQTLVLAPTRELAHGIRGVIASVGQYMDVKTMAFSPDINIPTGHSQIQAGVQILVSTPGRSSILLKKGILRYEQIKTVVIEDMDEMLSRGFEEALSDILNILPRSVQLIVTSVTTPPPIGQFIEQFMKNPVHAHWKTPKYSLERVRQFFVSVRNTEEKMEVLMNLLDVFPTERMIIYCNRRMDIDAVSAKINEYNLATASLVNDTSSVDRQWIFNHFRTGEIQVIVSSDLRIDYEVKRLASIKISYDLPLSKESYLVRFGSHTNTRFIDRSVCIILVTDADMNGLRAIEAFYQTKIQELPQDVSNLI